MLQVNDTTSNWSIWKGVNQEVFEKNIDTLHNIKRVVKPIETPANKIPSSSSSHKIPFQIEAQLVNDFAFLAAYDYGVKYVAAACLEESDTKGFTLRLAANEGVHGRVQSCISEILSYFSRCATKCITRENCRQKIFNAVIRLNCNRILGRLSSKHFSPPTYLQTNTKSAPIQRLVSIAQHLTVPKRKSGPVEDLDAFRSDVRGLHESFQELEDSTQETRLLSIGNIVKAAYRLTRDGVSLQNRLRSLGCDISTIESRAIHEINKVSNYWRICCNLAQLSRCREYRTLFVEPKLETLEPYERSLRTFRSRYVHAEIQLVVHYEIWPKECLPRIIGASKHACYLCYAFVRAHEQFHLLKSHGQIYNQWTIPDRRQYTLETLERFQKALTAVNQEVLDEIMRAQKGPKWTRAFPLQSLINLQVPSIPKGSDTTVKSSMDSRASIISRQLGRVDSKLRGSGIPSFTSGVNALTTKRNPEVRELHCVVEPVSSCQDDVSTLSQIQNVHQVGNVDAPINTTTPFSDNTDPSIEPSLLRFDWLDLYFYPFQASSGPRTDIELKRCEGDEKVQEDEDNIIDTDCWLPGNDIHIPINKKRLELKILFVSNLGRIKMCVTSQEDEC